MRGAGAEELVACSGDDRGPHVKLMIQSGDQIPDAVSTLWRQSIATLGAIDGDPGHAVDNLVTDLFFNGAFAHVPHGTGS